MTRRAVPRVTAVVARTNPTVVVPAFGEPCSSGGPMALDAAASRILPVTRRVQSGPRGLLGPDGDNPDVSAGAL
jgi:hypothetical protein